MVVSVATSSNNGASAAEEVMAWSWLREQDCTAGCQARAAAHRMDAQVPQLPAVVEQNTPEELSPLVDALERARQQLEEATGVREALEAEVGCCMVSHPVHAAPQWSAYRGAPLLCKDALAVCIWGPAAGWRSCPRKPHRP